MHSQAEMLMHKVSVRRLPLDARFFEGGWRSLSKAEIVAASVGAAGQLQARVRVGGAEWRWLLRCCQSVCCRRLRSMDRPLRPLMHKTCLQTCLMLLKRREERRLVLQLAQLAPECC